MTTYKTFEDLPIWNNAKVLAIEFLLRICNEKINNNYCLRDQMQRAVISISSNIAEGFERGSKKELIQYLYIAKGSVGELRSQLQIAKDCCFISEKNFVYLKNCCLHLSKQIHGFIEYLKYSNIQGQKYKEK